MRWFILFILIASPSFAASYVVQCNNVSGCLAPDGTTQPNGTYLNRIVVAPADIASGVAAPQSGTLWVPDTGQQIYISQ